jgi:hypothetical protein
MLGMPRCRSMGMLVACAVALQATGTLPLIANAEAASCCCHHELSQTCRCPTCTHAREMASDHSFIRTCAGTSDPAMIVVQVAPAVPQSAPLAALVLTAVSVLSPAQRRPPSPDREVPTPPPLA